MSAAPFGPEADLYLQHYHGTPSFRYAEQYWRQFQLNEKSPDPVSVASAGPEADLYLQHYHSTLSSRYASWYWSQHTLGGSELDVSSITHPS